MSSKTHPLLLEEAPHKEILLGNDAYVRGMIEAGVKIAAAYPGSPTSEIGVRLGQISKESGIYFEFSTNEKVATEVAASAAIGGAPATCFMKSVGLNVAADSFVHNLFCGLDTVSNNQDFSLANSSGHLCGPLGNLHPMPASSGSTLFFWLAGTLFLCNIPGLELGDRG